MERPDCVHVWAGFTKTSVFLLQSLEELSSAQISPASDSGGLWGTGRIYCSLGPKINLTIRLKTIVSNTCTANRMVNL